MFNGIPIYEKLSVKNVINNCIEEKIFNDEKLAGVFNDFGPIPQHIKNKISKVDEKFIKSAILNTEFQVVNINGKGCTLHHDISKYINIETHENSLEIEFMNAFVKKEYHKASEIYNSKIQKQGEFYKKEILLKIMQVLEVYYKNINKRFINEEITDDEFKSICLEISKYAQDFDIRGELKRIAKISKSILNFRDGQRYENENKNFVAYQKYSKVIPEDRNYSEAVRRMHNLKLKF